MADGLYTFGTLETVEVPSSGPGVANDATAKAPLGVMVKYEGNLYRYVYHYPGTAVATAAGAVAYWKSLDPAAGTFTVSSDQTDSIAGINAVAGLYGCVVTSQYYTWIQVGGVNSAALMVDGSMAAGAKCIGHTTDTKFGYVDAGTDNSDVVFGIVIGSIDITNYKAAVLLQNLAW